MKSERWRQVEELFHAALERAPEERQAFLGQACSEDTELKLQVEHLISIDQRAGSRLETAVIEEGTAALNADAPLEGAQVGPYRMLSSLGAGGMGKVYRARDTKLGRDVAMKTLPSEAELRIRDFHQAIERVPVAADPGGAPLSCRAAPRRQPGIGRPGE